MPVEILRYEADISALKTSIAEISASQKRMEDDTRESTQKASGHWDAMKVGIGAAVGGIAANLATNLAGKAREFIGSSIESASNLNETLSKTQVLFGDAAPSLVTWAEGAAKGLGQSKQQALDAASTFGVFGKSAGLAGDDLAAFAQQNTKMASDLASFHNTSPQEAIEAIGSALRGEAEPIRKYGILLDDATLRNQALKMGLISTTSEALTPSQKVLAAQAQIMAQAGVATDDFARTSGGLANQQRIVAAETENAKAKFGEALLPVQLAVAQAMQTYLIPALTAVAGWISTVSTYLQEHSAVGKAVAIIIGVALVGAFLAWAASAAAAAVSTLIAIAPVLAIAAAIAALVAGIIWAYQNVDWFRNSVQVVAAFLRDTLWPIIQQVASVIEAYLVFEIKAVIWYLQLWWEAIQTLYNVASGIFFWLRDNVPPIISGLVGAIIGFKDTIVNIAGLITQPFRSAFNGIASAWNNTVGRLSFSIPDWVPGLGGKGFSVPDIPTFDTGAYVRGPVVAALAQNNVPEIVSPVPQLREIIRQESGGRGAAQLSVTYVMNGATALTSADLDRSAADAAFRLRVGATA